MTKFTDRRSQTFSKNVAEPSQKLSKTFPMDALSLSFIMRAYNPITIFK